MSYIWNRVGRLSAISAVCSLAVWLGTSSAEETSVLVSKTAAPSESPQTGPALPPPSNPREYRVGGSSDPYVPPLSIPRYTARKVEIPPQEMPAPAVQPQELPAPAVPPQDSPSQPKRPFLRPAEPRAPGNGSLVGVESIPSPPGDAPTETLPGVTVTQPGAESLQVRPAPSIKYDTDHDARRLYRSGKIDLIMLTKDPTGSCAYEIPMCIPSCCVGEPLISAREGIFGRGIVEYRWACGFRAIVKFRHVLGDIRVDYEGD